MKYCFELKNKKLLVYLNVTLIYLTLPITSCATIQLRKNIHRCSTFYLTCVYLFHPRWNKIKTFEILRILRNRITIPWLINDKYFTRRIRDESNYYYCYYLQLFSFKRHNYFSLSIIIFSYCDRLKNTITTRQTARRW